MTTEEKNILIALFMGAKFSNYGDGTKGVIFDSSVNPEGYLPLLGIEGLKYHTSWDWLMPVVIKICNSDAPIKRRSEVYFSQTPDINKMFNAVCEFIEWYNENEKEKR